MPDASRPSTPAQGDDELLEIFHALKRGVGRELVTDSNVDGLIGLAHAYGQQQLEYLLREWRSTCGEDAENMNFELFSKQPPTA
ncbi:hypothetical protein [Caenimonas soli]|uniref:hypothetical protein n=1 Tax=Caenimonas soli TaxID=2735555 RepID=UPI00155348F7|nr:hypothetical protein [Caenimonas soli]NPC58450.1 hypothetical protein [Caenimonas soli]